MRNLLSIFGVFFIIIVAQCLDFKELCNGVPNEEYIASPSGEEYYIQCFDNINDCYEDKCPDSEPVFVPEEHLCMERPETTTTTITTPSTTSTVNTVKTTISTTEESTIPTSSSTSTPDPNLEKCPVKDNPKVLVLLPDSESCSGYFICYHGKPVRLECPSLLQFNPKINKCDFPVNVNCTIGNSSELPKCKNNKGEEFYSHPEKCKYFIYCINGFRTVQQCAYFHHWSQKESICIKQNLSECIDSKE